MAGKKIYVKGFLFDSKLEAEHYTLLEQYKDTVEVLELQPVFNLFPRFTYYNIETEKDATYSKMIYTPDFLIQVKGIDRPIAVEVKGFRRPEYMMRRKLFIMKYVAEGDFYFFESNKVKDLRDFLNKWKDKIEREEIDKNE